MALLLGGVAVDDEAVWELTELVETPLRQKLETALRFRDSVVDMTPDDRKAILRALEDAPDSPRGVRELLLTDERWRQSLTDLQQDRLASSSIPPSDEWPAARSVASSAGRVCGASSCACCGDHVRDVAPERPALGGGV